MKQLSMADNDTIGMNFDTYELSYAQVSYNSLQI